MIESKEGVDAISDATAMIKKLVKNTEWQKVDNGIRMPWAYLNVLVWNGKKCAIDYCIVNSKKELRFNNIPDATHWVYLPMPPNSEKETKDANIEEEYESSCMSNECNIWREKNEECKSMV